MRPRAQGANRLADRDGGGQRRYARSFLHALCCDVVVVVREQTGGSLRQGDHFHLGGSKQFRLVGNIRIEAGQERRVAAALAEPADMHLKIGWQHSRVLDLDRCVGRRDQHAEMSHGEYPPVVVNLYCISAQGDRI